jgi:hypothetical protein
MTSTDDVIRAVREQHGINLSMANTGGGCYVLEGRLEDGSWIRAADHEDFCYPELKDRHKDEKRDGPLGWDVSFHSNEHDPGGPMTFSDGQTIDFPPSDTWASGDTEPIHWHEAPDAYVHELPQVIADAFASMPPDAKQKQQDGLRQQLTNSGWTPGSEEWLRHFPNETGSPGAGQSPDYENLVNPKHDLNDDFGDIFGRQGRRRRAVRDDLPPLPDDFHVPDSPEGQPDRSPGWLHRQFIGPHKSVWDIPEHELDDRWNKVYDTLGFDSQTREKWEKGRRTDNPSDKWDAGMDGMLGGGLKDYLTRAPMSKDEYARHREHSQNRAKEMADGLWGAMFPPEEEEGRKAVQNMDTVNNLMANGWQPDHIKYDEDGEPYALYRHPSGWTVKDSGYNYKDIGHAATPGEAHDVINVSRHDRDSGTSYNAPFGPADAHAFIEDQLHGDPEETGGTLQYLTQNHPAIRRYKPRRANRILASLDMADIYRLAGDGMSYEDTMRYIDEALAGGEPEDHSDYSTDYYVDAPSNELEDDPESRRLADEAYRQQQEGDLRDRLWDQWMGQLSGKHHRWLEEVDGKAMDHDFAAYHDHHLRGTPYTMTPVPQDELHRQQQTLNPPHTAALDMADIYRLAGDGMSWEDTISHIDKVLAEGEGHDLHDVPGADYFAPEHSGYYDHSDIVDHCRDCGGDGVDWNGVPSGEDGNLCASCRGTGENQGDPYGQCAGCGQEFRADELRGDGPEEEYCGNCAPQRHASLDMADIYRLAGDGMSWDDTMRYIDETLAEGEKTNLDDYFNDDYLDGPHPGTLPRPGQHTDPDDPICPTCNGPEGKSDPYCPRCGLGEDGDLWQTTIHRAALDTADPSQMAQQQPMMPAAGGFLPAHRVGLDWRDSTVPGTVIGLDGDRLSVRWDDGQYTSEDPTEVHLL